MAPDPKKVAARWASSRFEHGPRGRPKIAGEIRHVKDRTEDSAESWGWPSNPPPSSREIQKDVFIFNAKYLKPLAKSMRSALMALGHAASAYETFTKIKSRNISPDGALGGKGYIQKIPDMRKQLMNCVEALSAFTDTVYDEIKAPHWNSSEDTLDARTRRQVREIIEDSEQIREDPENWAEEAEEEAVENLQEEEDPSLDKPSTKKVASRFLEIPRV